MDLDLSTLRWARVENLERLARSLGVALPDPPKNERYHRVLVRRLALRFEAEKQADLKAKRGSRG